MKPAALLWLVGLASAHFTLDYPPTRGFDEDTEPTPICGGFNTITNRTVYPLGQAQIQITSLHTLASVFAEISFDSNPTSFSQFNTSSNGTNYPFLIGANQIPEGSACYNVDISGLDVSDAKNGTEATIVVIYDGGDGQLFQCADVTLVENATIPSGSIQSGLTCLSVSSNSTVSNSTSASVVRTPLALPWTIGLTGLFGIILAGMSL